MKTGMRTVFVKLKKPEPAMLLSLLLTSTGTGGAPLVEAIVLGIERLSKFMMPPYWRLDKRRARRSKYIERDSGSGQSRT